MREHMKARFTAVVILLYLLLIVASSMLSLVLHQDDIAARIALGFGGTGVAAILGVLMRINWCRIFLGIGFALILADVLLLPFFPDSELRFRGRTLLGYLATLAITSFPVFLLFFYAPLRNYTRHAHPKA